MADAAPNRVPGLARLCQSIVLHRPVLQAPRYCLSFTAAGLRPELAAVIAAIHLEQEGDWGRTKAVVLERNALQARSSSTGVRLESELRQRLRLLTPPQLRLLAQGRGDERRAMAWLAVLKRMQIASDLVREVLLAKLRSLDPVLRRSDLAAFYEDRERAHPELAALAPSSQRKVRSVLLQMLRDAGLLAGKGGKGGTLGLVQRPLLSPRVQELVVSDDPQLLAGFLLLVPASQAKSRKAPATPAPASMRRLPGSPAKPVGPSAARPTPKSSAKAAAKAAGRPAATRATSSRRTSA